MPSTVQPVLATRDVDAALPRVTEPGGAVHGPPNDVPRAGGWPLSVTRTASSSA
ncbi:hypothetical protein [Geodermatophilus sp. SYSU D00696]